MSPKNYAMVMVVMAIFGFHHVQAGSCDASQLRNCLTPLGDFDFSNIGVLCKSVNSIIQCFDQLKNECHLDPEMFKEYDVQVEELKEKCKGFEKSTGECSINDLQACAPSDMSEASDLSQMCKEMEKSMECLKTLKAKCAVHSMKEIIQNSIDQMSQNMQCSAQQTCTPADQAKCMKPMESLKDHTKSCSAFKEVTNCLKAMKTYCKDEEEKNIQKTIDENEKQMKCCEVVTKVRNDCLNNGYSVENFRPTDEQCMKLETTWTCTKSISVESCQHKTMKAPLIKNMNEMSEKLDSCKKSGYNVTVEYSKKDQVITKDDDPGSSGTVLYQTIVFVLSAFLVGHYTF